MTRDRAGFYHIGMNDEERIPFFPDEETAKDHLVKRADAGYEEPFARLSLYKARIRKVGGAADVLTDQVEVEDFPPDGGR